MDNPAPTVAEIGEKVRYELQLHSEKTFESLFTPSKDGKFKCSLFPNWQISLDAVTRVRAITNEPLRPDEIRRNRMWSKADDRSARKRT